MSSNRQAKDLNYSALKIRQKRLPKDLEKFESEPKLLTKQFELLDPFQKIKQAANSNADIIDR